jgi:hypothetical protein
MARVTRGFTTEDVIVLALSTRRPYERAKAAECLYQTSPEGTIVLPWATSMASFRRWLEKLAEFGYWGHSGEPPGLPAEYADAPSLSNAAVTLACGVELTGSLHNKALPKGSQKKLQLVRVRSKDLASSLLNLTSCPRRCSRLFTKCCALLLWLVGFIFIFRAPRQLGATRN